MTAWKRYIGAMLVGAAVLASAPAANAYPVTPARAAAILACNTLAARYPETTWSSLEFELYRACMAQHGQTE